ncbi:hypothetical protein Bhyg_07074, partial [Pseudolycoriella hygida]
MSSGSDIEKFWDLLELKLGCSVPKYVQNILTLNGFDSVLSIKTITSDDIEYFRNYARSEMNRRIPMNANLNDYYGSYSDTPTEFEFLRGHIRLLEQIVLLINEIIATKGPEFFILKTPKNQANKNIFLSDINVQGEKQALNSDGILPTLSQANVEANVGNISTSIIRENENVSVESGPNEPSTSEQAMTKFNQEKSQIHSNVVSWLQRNARSVYEQHQHGLSVDLVKIASKDEKGTVSAGIKCLVCADVIQVTKTGTYFVLSNFHKHIRSHLKKQKMKRKLRGSKVPKKPVKRKSRRLYTEKVDTDVCTSSDSEDTAAIAKEILIPEVAMIFQKILMKP